MTPAENICESARCQVIMKKAQAMCKTDEEIMRKELYDLEPRTYKRSQLFTCCMLPHVKLPFIIGYFTGDGMETGYAVHESGHGFAFYTAARKQALYELHRSSPAVNEIHSKTMEHFMFPYLDMFVGT